jgi:hypothetical protein
MKRVIFILFLIVFARYAYAQAVSDYLITNDIGSYKQITKGGPTGNILAGADHFALDHKDISYGISYVNDTSKIWIDVQVTQHVGVDSDKWLRHELGWDFRNYYGLPGDTYVTRVINGNTIMAVGSGGWDYRWLSGNIVVHIEYTDLQMTKPEPLEVVEAYLAKFPSILSPETSADLRTTASETQWIKDEMDRRLWLCDKWFGQLDIAKVQEKQADQEAVKSMNVFLDYREKYYGIKAEDEKNALAGYRYQNDTDSIKSKLDEYKTWWGENRAKEINLP